MPFVLAVVLEMYSDLEPRLIVLGGKNLQSCIPSLMVHRAVYMTHMVMEMVLTLLRSRWAAWEHPTGEDAVYLSGIRMPVVEHKNDTFYDSSGPVAGSADLFSLFTIGLSIPYVRCTI